MRWCNEPINVRAVPYYVERQIGKGSGSFVHRERRYALLNADTKEIYDDAQGFGYKSMKSAMAAHKNRIKMQR